MIADDDYTYFGGKSLSGVSEWICSQLTTHVYYAEVFAGKGAVYRRKLPALRSWLIDRDPEIVHWWDRQLESSRQHSHSRRCPRYHTVVEQGDGIRFVELAAEWKIPNLLIYADPPYLLETRTSGPRYRYELTFAQHERLLRAMLKLKGPAFISGYESNLYNNALRKWDVMKRQVVTRDRGRKATECLWRNPFARDASKAWGFEYWELADDYRARQAVGRKVQRWKAKFAELTEKERRAILYALLEEERQAKRSDFRSKSIPKG